MDSRTFILGLLMINSMSGYDIKKTFNMSFSFFSGLSYGSIYPALKKLEEEKAITMNVEIQENAPNKKIYTITKMGKDLFLKSLKEPVIEDKIKSSFLSKLFFFSELTSEERFDLTSQYLKIVKRKKDELETYNDTTRRVGDPFQQINYEFGLRFFTDLTKNIEETIKKLENLD